MKNDENWLINYNLLKEYYITNNNIDIPLSYKIQGIKLGVWLNNQKINYRNNKLDSDRITLLEKLNINWYTRKQKTNIRYSWDLYYALCKTYYSIYNNLDIPSKYKVTYKDKTIFLGNWLHQQRCAKRNNTLPKNKEELLNKLGILWDYKQSVKEGYITDKWLLYYEELKKYYIVGKPLHLKVDTTVYINNTPFNLSSWVNRLRSERKNNLLSPNKIKLLDKINFVWDEPKTIYHESTWYDYYNLAKEYYLKHGNLLITSNYYVYDKNLGRWINTQRKAYKGKNNRTITKEKIDLLNNIGMLWNLEEINNKEWLLCLKEVINRYKNNLSLDTLFYLTSKKKVNLLKWYNKQLDLYDNNLLDTNKRALIKEFTEEYTNGKQMVKIL